MSNEKSSTLIQMTRNASEKIRLQERHEERENALLEQLAAAYAARKSEAASHATALEQREQAHAATVAALTTTHAHTVAALTMHAAAPAKPTMRLSEAIEYVKGEKETYGKQSINSAKEYAAAYSILLQIVGDKPISGIEYQDAKEFYQKVTKLPPNINKIAKYRGKSIDEIIAMGDTPISARTAEKYLERASGLFDFLLLPNHKKASGISENPFSGISSNVRAAKNSDNAPSANKRAYSIDELRALLSHSSYTSKKFKNPYEYWLIPLALLTGARQNELCQLHLSDFIQQEDVWCINITDEEEEKRSRTRTQNDLSQFTTSY
ncbi:hypothetical protein ACFSQE_06430 [Vogesella fluminis]|uniref:hypothetical protein n=1 Tax=Vogesella fluminis TaxID=1069161 RepID=UPI00363F59DE